MPAITDDQIDPQLRDLEENDPSMRFFRRNQPQTNSFEDETDDFPLQITQDRQSTPSSGDITPFNGDTSNFSGISSFIRMLKQRKKFSDAAEADLELYSQVIHISIACLN